jgi:hypothetical protein
MDAQLKKYVGTLRANGIMVHKGIMNQIRYRTRKREPMTPEEKFQREYGVYTVNTEEIRQVMRDQILVSDRITDRKIMSREAASLAAVRNMGRLTCERCPFFELCRSELLGEDISVAIEANYQSNKYVELYEELGGMSND